MFKRFDILKVLSFFFIFIIAGSCTSNDRQKEQVVPNDQQIRATLTDQYQETPSIDGSSIKIEVSDGIVTLSGELNSMLARNRAEDMAKITRGVRSIVNNIGVKTSRNDQAIKKDVTKALFADPATEPYELGVEVSNGKAILTGAVNSWQEREIASHIAAGVKGVTAIENRITIDSITTRSDADIKHDIEKSLAWDVRIDDGPINVSVNDGVVSLTGSVGSISIKDLVESKAYVEGVSKVQTSKLEVMPGMDDSMVRVEEPDLADSDIEEAINRAWKKNPRVKQYSLDVQVDQGVASLSGKVDNLNSKLAAAENARNTIGVEAVNNNITTEQKVVVRPDLKMTDSAIKDRIRSSIIRDPYSEIDEISIEVDNGVATLTGTVQSGFEKDHAAQLASNTVGVLSIDNRLNIEPVTSNM